MLRTRLRSTLKSTLLTRCIRNLTSTQLPVMAEENSNPAKKMKTEETTTPSTDKEIDNESTVIRESRLPRKKCILLMSYCGKGYLGMQKNPGTPTIEDELLKALWKARAISEAHKDNLHKLGFQRCARTDKGVSAARQVVSLKINPDIIPVINEHLPEQIRVIGLKRVTNGFNSKVACTSRIYEYVTPTYVFAPFKETNMAFRISATLITRIQNILTLYHGTHNFHNFTSGRKFDDPSAKRYIMSFSVGDPFLCNDLEFISLKVEGQSFMLHQIRKMIGLLIAVVRGYVKDDCIVDAFGPPKFDIPRAPPVGLFLDSVCYRNYNLRFGEDGVHEKLDWTQYEQTVAEFKDRFIYKHIMHTELREHTMLQWLLTLQLHEFQQKPPPDTISTSKDSIKNIDNVKNEDTAVTQTSHTKESDTGMNNESIKTEECTESVQASSLHQNQLTETTDKCTIIK